MAEKIVDGKGLSIIIIIHIKIRQYLRKRNSVGNSLNYFAIRHKV